MTLSTEFVTKEDDGFLVVKYRGNTYPKVPIKFLFEPIDDYLKYRENVGKKKKLLKGNFLK